MTVFQLIASVLALLTTLYCVPVPWRKGERMTGMGAVVWVASIALAVVAWVGVK